MLKINMLMFIYRVLSRYESVYFRLTKLPEAYRETLYFEKLESLMKKAGDWIRDWYVTCRMGWRLLRPSKLPGNGGDAQIPCQRYGCQNNLLLSSLSALLLDSTQ